MEGNNNFVVTKGINDLTDQKFGSLTAKKPVDKDKHRNIMWECECDCGNTCIKRGSDLITGKFTCNSCGEKKVPTRYRVLVDRKTSSTYKGVSWSKAANRWTAHIVFNGIHYNLGLFYDEELAAITYNTKMKELIDNDFLLKKREKEVKDGAITTRSKDMC